MSCILKFGILAVIALLYNAPTVFTQRSPTVDEYHVSNVENGVQEIVAVSGKVVAVETRQTGKLIARQITNGVDFLTLVYVDDERLVACEQLQGRSPELDRFVDQQLIRKLFQRTGVEGAVKEIDDMLNGSLLDWDRSWTECARLQEAKKEQRRPAGVAAAAVHPPSSRSRTRRAGLSLIVPGTTWCGVGNASNADDAADGAHVETDRCCRQHDLCQYTIDGFSRKYNLFNFRFHTVSHCECDETFRRCLKMAGDENSNIVGRLFFNVLGLKCFILLPETVCVERAWWGKCVRYGQEPSASIRDSSPY